MLADRQQHRRRRGTQDTCFVVEVSGEEATEAKPILLQLFWSKWMSLVKIVVPSQTLRQLSFHYVASGLMIIKSQTQTVCTQIQTVWFLRKLIHDSALIFSDFALLFSQSALLFSDSALLFSDSALIFSDFYLTLIITHMWLTGCWQDPPIISASSLFQSPASIGFVAWRLPTTRHSRFTKQWQRSRDVLLHCWLNKIPSSDSDCDSVREFVRKHMTKTFSHLVS